MREWLNFMPLFVVKWVARRYGESFVIGGVRMHSATPGVYVQALNSEK